MTSPGEKQALITLKIQLKLKKLDSRQRQNTITTTAAANNNVIHQKQTSCQVH